LTVVPDGELSGRDPSGEGARVSPLGPLGGTVVQGSGRTRGGAALARSRDTPRSSFRPDAGRRARGGCEPARRPVARSPRCLHLSPRGSLRLMMETPLVTVPRPFRSAGTGRAGTVPARWRADRAAAVTDGAFAGVGPRSPQVPPRARAVPRAFLRGHPPTLDRRRHRIPCLSRVPTQTRDSASSCWPRQDGRRS